MYHAWPSSPKYIATQIVNHLKRNVTQALSSKKKVLRHIACDTSLDREGGHN